MCDTTSAGDGLTFPQPGDLLTVNYTGKLGDDGTIFDSSQDSNFQFQVGVGQV